MLKNSAKVLTRSRLGHARVSPAGDIISEEIEETDNLKDRE